jgi:hypothetical protein
MEARKLNLTPNMQRKFDLLLETIVSPDILNNCLADLGMHLNANSVMRDDGDGQGTYIFTLDFDEFELKFPVVVGTEWGVARGAAKLYYTRILKLRSD